MSYFQLNFSRNRLVALLLLVAAAIGVLFWNVAVTATATPLDVTASTMTVDEAAQGAGGTVEFTITIKRSGASLETISMANTLPAGLVLDASSAAVVSLGNGQQTAFSAAGNTVSWSGALLDAGEVVIRYAATVDAAATVGATLVNEAIITDTTTSVTVSADVVVTAQPVGPSEVYLPTLFSASTPGLCYQEQNGIVLLDVEQQEPNGWIFVQDVPGYAGDGYYTWPGGPDDILGGTGQGHLEFKILIENPGTYALRMHAYSKHPDPEKATEANDIYTAINGVEFHKTVAWSYQWGEWGWATGREEGGVVYNPPTFNFGAGLHTVTVAARSSTFGLDRLVLYKDQARDDAAAKADFTGMPTSNLCVGFAPPTVDHSE